MKNGMKKMLAKIFVLFALIGVASSSQALGIGSLIVTMTSPSSGATVSNTTQVSASVSLIGAVTVSSVQFQLDGANLGNAIGAAPYSMSWNTSGASNGTHTLVAVARDLLGIGYASNPVTFTVYNAPPADTTPPYVSISAPASGATVSGTITVSANASDNVGVAGVQFQLDGVNSGSEIASPPYSKQWDTAATGNGAHTITAIARDAAGNRTTSAPVTVTVNNGAPSDTTPPYVSISAPASGATVSGTITVSANASDNVGVAGVQFQLDGVNSGSEITSAPYSKQWNTAASSNGAHTITAIARDAAGNRTTSTPVTVTVNNGAPPDTTPPYVSISAPASGATVSGTITVSANASDNVGVAGVQFQLDGVNGGSEITSAPYSIQWNTATTGDGAHTITAIARDAAGNRATSAPVTVTVANGTPPPQAKRIEENDPSVSYSSGWTQGDTSRSWSGGTAALSQTAGAQATFTFTGPSVSWIGGRGNTTGIARVSLDGTFVAAVDTYSKTEEIRVPMFTAAGLANTSHTLTIEVGGTRNAAATGTLIIVDAIDVPAPAVSRLQETDPDISYTAGWTQGDTSRAWSAGAAAISAASGAQAVFAFSGTSVTWLGARSPLTGIARVSMDGKFLADVDTYASAEEIQAAVYTATGLADTNHTLTVEALGQKNAASTGSQVVVDGFEVTRPGTRYQESSPGASYSSGWAMDNRDKAYSEGASAETNVPGASATITFTGTGIRWIGARGPQTGIASVSLDGVSAGSIDTYAPTEGPQHTDFTAQGLALGTHTLTISVSGKNPASTNYWILLDAFDVTP